MWAKSVLVGCGFQKCDFGILYVCNYGPGGNVNGPGEKGPDYPYETGVQASACPGKETDGLCDCGGLVCLSKGVFDLKTCSCKCKYDKDYFKKPDCAVDCSKAKDNEFVCTEYSPEDKMCKPSYSNVPFQYCPIKCGLCPKGSGPPPKPEQPCTGMDKCKIGSSCLTLGQTIKENGNTCFCKKVGYKIISGCQPEGMELPEAEEDQEGQCPKGNCKKGDICVSPGETKNIGKGESCTCSVTTFSDMQMLSLRCQQEITVEGKRSIKDTFESHVKSRR